MTKFKSQALYIIRIKYWKASGIGNPPFLIPTFQKIATYVLKMKFYVLMHTTAKHFLETKAITYLFMNCGVLVQT